MKKLLAALVAALCLAGSGAAFAGAVVAPTGPLEPSQIQAIIGQTVANVNAGVDGVIATLQNDQATAANQTPTVLYAITIPQSIFTLPGQVLRVSCWGNMGATNNGKVVALSLGYSDGKGPATTSYFSSAVANSGATNGASWRIVMDVNKTNTAATPGSPSGWVNGYGVVGATAISNFSAANTSAFSGPQSALCWGINQSSTANDIVGRGMLVEQLK